MFADEPGQKITETTISTSWTWWFMPVIPVTQ
jgi:hypothetical protein